MNNKGFVNIILILVAISVLGVGGYFVFSKKSVNPPENQRQQILTEQPQNTTQTETPSKLSSESAVIPSVIGYRDEVAGVGFERPNKSVGLTSELAAVDTFL